LASPLNAPNRAIAPAHAIVNGILQDFIRINYF
jgi:hypothetical protein